METWSDCYTLPGKYGLSQQGGVSVQLARSSRCGNPCRCIWWNQNEFGLAPFMGHGSSHGHDIILCFQFWLPVRVWEEDLQYAPQHRVGHRHFQRPPRAEEQQPNGNFFPWVIVWWFKCSHFQKPSIHMLLKWNLNSYGEKYSHQVLVLFSQNLVA